MNSYKPVLRITGLGELLPLSVFSTLGRVTVYCFGSVHHCGMQRCLGLEGRGLQVRTPHHRWLEGQHDCHFWVQRLGPP